MYLGRRRRRWPGLTWATVLGRQTMALVVLPLLQDSLECALECSLECALEWTSVAQRATSRIGVARAAIRKSRRTRNERKRESGRRRRPAALARAFLTGGRRSGIAAFSRAAVAGQACRLRCQGCHQACHRGCGLDGHPKRWGLGRAGRSHRCPATRIEASAGIKALRGLTEAPRERGAPEFRGKRRRSRLL